MFLQIVDHYGLFWMKWTNENLIDSLYLISTCYF
jgi:hypothetical protein